MYLFDTNIFLEHLLDQEQSKSCRALIKTINQDKNVWVSLFSIHAIEAILEGRTKSNILLLEFLTHIQFHPYIQIYATTLEEEIEILKLSPQLKLDFDDSLQYYIAKKKSLTLVTLDKDFRKIKDILVLSPKQILGDL
ncbi:MAG: type II toxin-antitoxin system VapC family toxin [Deltaproteobacteria bacterium]|nr:type II toxin-antitoxin system VapC family toxin [Deltaproteobacteria bacterium]